MGSRVLARQRWVRHCGSSLPPPQREAPALTAAALDGGVCKHGKVGWKQNSGKHKQNRAQQLHICTTYNLILYCLKSDFILSLTRAASSNNFTTIVCDNVAPSLGWREAPTLLTSAGAGHDKHFKRRGFTSRTSEKCYKFWWLQYCVSHCALSKLRSVGKLRFQYLGLLRLVSAPVSMIVCATAWKTGK